MYSCLIQQVRIQLDEMRAITFFFAWVKRDCIKTYSSLASVGEAIKSQSVLIESGGSERKKVGTHAHIQDKARGLHHLSVQMLIKWVGRNLISISMKKSYARIQNAQLINKSVEGTERENGSSTLPLLRRNGVGSWVGTCLLTPLIVYLSSSSVLVSVRDKSFRSWNQKEGVTSVTEHIKVTIVEKS